MFLFFQSKRKDNKLLKTQSFELQTSNEEVRKTNEELKTTNDELLSANEELNTLNDTINISFSTIQKQRDQIFSSLQYAQRIQHSILPSSDYLQSIIPNHFIFYKPLDVVSGDFYWCTKLNPKSMYEVENAFEGKGDMVKDLGSEKIVLAAIDCTGHGVPGAFMSMVGNTLLNNIVKEKQIAQANEILTELHKGIRQVLQQKETKNSEGMDLALVVIDLVNKTLEFSGAKNPIVYIQDSTLHLIKGDKMAVGGHQREKERNFTKHTISFSESPISFYLFSDGYQDQFGGSKNRKFMSKRLRDLFYEIHPESMEEQQSILNQTFIEWKGNEDQIDDVLIIGGKLD